LKMPLGDESWNDVIPEDCWFTADLVIEFRGEVVRTGQQLRTKLDTLFGQDVIFTDMGVSRSGTFFRYQVVLDSVNLAKLTSHDNYGRFEGDYTVEIMRYRFNRTEEGTVERDLESPLKRMTKAPVRAGQEKELVITMRRGPNPTDAPARGMQSFRILTEMTEVKKILGHFNLLGRVTRVTKATPVIPTLVIGLEQNVEEVKDSIEELPLRVYNPSPQSRFSGSTELWAHLRIDKDQFAKRVTIEGVKGRANLDEIRHKLSYHGEIKAELAPGVWTRVEGEELANVENGDLVFMVDIIYELNFIITGRTAFKVSYQGQAQQCNICYSWDHVARECTRKDERRDDLMKSYHEKWKRQMNYQKIDELDRSMTEPRNIDLVDLARNAARVAEDAARTKEEAKAAEVASKEADAKAEAALEKDADGAEAEEAVAAAKEAGKYAIYKGKEAALVARMAREAEEAVAAREEEEAASAAKQKAEEGTGEGSGGPEEGEGEVGDGVVTKKKPGEGSAGTSDGKEREEGTDGKDGEEGADGKKEEEARGKEGAEGYKPGKSKDAGGAGARRTGTEEGSKVGESKEHEDKKDGEKEKEEERAGDDTGDVGKREEELEEEEVEDGEEEEEEEEDDDEDGGAETKMKEKDAGAMSKKDKAESKEQEDVDEDGEEVTVEKDTGAASAIDKVEPKEDETKKAIEEAIKSMREEKETMAITDKLSAEAARLAAVGENVKEKKKALKETTKTTSTKRKPTTPTGNNSKVTGSGKKKVDEAEKIYLDYKKELGKLETRYKKENGKEKAKTKKEAAELLEKTKKKLTGESGAEGFWMKCKEDAETMPWRTLPKLNTK